MIHSFSKTRRGPLIWSVEGRDKHTGEDRQSVVVASSKKQAAAIAHGRGVVVSSLKTKPHAPPPPVPPEQVLKQLSDSSFGSSATLEPGGAPGRLPPTPPPMPQIPLPREQAVAAVLDSSPEKYLYHEDYTRCLRRIIRFVLAIYGTGPARRGSQTIDPLETLLGRFHLESLFPGHSLNAKKARRALLAAAERVDAGSIENSCVVFDWDFIFERHLREIIPKEELSLRGKGQLTYAEVTCVFQSARRLLRRHKRQCAELGCPDTSDGWWPIPRRYFLGDRTRGARPARPARPGGVSAMKPEEAWEMAFQAGYAAGLNHGLRESRETGSGYATRFRRKTGRALTATKLSAIFNLLDRYGLLLRQEVASAKNPRWRVNAFKLGPNASFEITFNLFDARPTTQKLDSAP